ncbi:hypothetical protein DRQ53_15235, partial [bacterium]
SILGIHHRKLTDGFLELTSHYLFDYHFCTVRRPNEKGVVETTGKYARRNFLVPVPVMSGYDELNAHLHERCLADLDRPARGGPKTKAELLTDESESFLPLPKSPFDACRKQATRVNSLSLVRFQGNNYSLPVRYGHHQVTVKGCPATITFAGWRQLELPVEAALSDRVRIGPKRGLDDHGRSGETLEAETYGWNDPGSGGRRFRDV